MSAQESSQSTLWCVAPMPGAQAAAAARQRQPPAPAAAGSPAVPRSHRWAPELPGTPCGRHILNTLHRKSQHIGMGCSAVVCMCNPARTQPGPACGQSAHALSRKSVCTQPADLPGSEASFNYRVTLELLLHLPVHSDVDVSQRAARAAGFRVPGLGVVEGVCHGVQRSVECNAVAVLVQLHAARAAFRAACARHAWAGARPPRRSTCYIRVCSWSGVLRGNIRSNSLCHKRAWKL